jgi:hypothetical protein
MPACAQSPRAKSLEVLPSYDDRKSAGRLCRRGRFDPHTRVAVRAQHRVEQLVWDGCGGAVHRRRPFELRAGVGSSEGDSDSQVGEELRQYGEVRLADAYRHHFGVLP